MGKKEERVQLFIRMGRTAGKMAGKMAGRMAGVMSGSLSGTRRMQRTLSWTQNVSFRSGTGFLKQLIKQRNNNFIKNILVFLINNFISTNGKEVKFCSSPIGSNKIVRQEIKNIPDEIVVLGFIPFFCKKKTYFLFFS